MPDDTLGGKICDLFDLELLQMLVHGIPVVKRDGTQKTLKDGTPVYRRPNAPELTVIERRIAKLSGTAKRALDSIGAEALLEKAEERIRDGTIKFDGRVIRSSLPDVDTKGDDAATRSA